MMPLSFERTERSRSSELQFHSAIQSIGCRCGTLLTRSFLRRLPVRRDAINDYARSLRSYHR